MKRSALLVTSDGQRVLPETDAFFAVEGRLVPGADPIGFAVRSYCRRQRRPFTTSYTTRFPEYISARSPIPQAWIYATLRWFHSAATVTMVATPSLTTEFSARGFANLGRWTRGGDAALFRPDRAIVLG